MIKMLSIKRIITLLVLILFQFNQIVFASESLRGHVIYLPENMDFEAVMQSSLDSELLTNGDVISAVVSKDWKYNDIMIAPKGSILYGKITDIQKAGNFQKSGRFTLEFNEVLTPNGKISIKTKTINIKSDSKQCLRIIAKFIFGVVVGAAVVGVTILTGGAATPVALAITSGTIGIASASAKGNDVKIPAGTKFHAHLKEPTTLTIIE